MPDVRRVEGAAEHAERAERSPADLAVAAETYLVDVSSRRPIGPRACSFWVELPISAPIPNSKPSVNRVDALT